MWKGRSGASHADPGRPSRCRPASAAHPFDAEDIADSLRAFGLYMRAIAAHLCRLSFLHRGQASDEAGNEGAVHCAGLRRLADAIASVVELRDTS
jgi:hypothetical protein